MADMLMPPGGSGIEQHVHEVRGQVRGQDGKRDDEEDPLEERVVAVVDRLQQDPAHARVAEDDLGEQRPGHDEADRQGEPGHARQDRVPRRQATSTPMSVPRTKLMMVATPTSPSVHGSAPLMTLLTVVG
jgi:hypothetical protein